MGVGTIVALLDGSPSDHDVLRQVQLVAGRPGQVVPLAGSLLPPGGTAWDACALDSLYADAWAYVRAVARRFARECAVDPPHVMVRLGRPGKGVADAIVDGSTGLVVMATHAHGSWRRMLLGSVTDEVLRETSLPVVLVHPHALPTAPVQIIHPGPMHAVPASAG